MSATGFELVRSRAVDALNLTVEEYQHISGARHYHLANDYSENVFMLALRTVPEDSTGVAHILEHTALCGSARFPVRDPFFLMIRRSLNTFMNAFTTSDYTAYPFASQNRKDYFNLMEVYLDAVFFSRLDPLDFAQEGHRVEFESPDDPTTPLVYKGVVYNEMKGDTSSPVSMLYHAIQETLYPTSTYHFNSGGDPEVIPELTYDGLIDFYRSHYHPANAVFMTFGDITAEEQQVKIAELALNQITPVEQPEISVKPEQRFDKPVSAEYEYPCDDDDLSEKTHIVLGWLLGRNTDLKMLLKGHLLSDVLLDTSASPLRLALEKTDLATGVSPMCGFEEDHMEMNFMCGVEGSEPQHADEIEALVFSVLRKVADEGVEQTKLEAVLHQLELSQREVGGDGMPFGLQLIFSCMSAAVHRGDPIGLLDIDHVLEELREEIADPDFIKHLVQELLIDNPHRVRVVMKPSREMGAELLAREVSKLENMKAVMSEADREALIRQSEALAARQRQEEDLSVLPQVTIADIPDEKHYPSPTTHQYQRRITTCAAGTNGLTYHQIVSPLPLLPEESLRLLPLYSTTVTEVGSAGRDYLSTQHVQHSVSGGISAFSSLRSERDDTDQYRGYLTLSSRTLNPKALAMAELLKQTAMTPRFDELERIREIVQQVSLRRINSIASNGHQYAMSAAAAPLRTVAALNDQLSGVEGIMRMAALASRIDDQAELERLGTALNELHILLRANSEQLLMIAESGFLENFTNNVLSLWSDEPEKTGSAVLPQMPLTQSEARAFVATTQVNYCAAAFATVEEASPDAAALSILAAVLRNNFLHQEIREKGGAYGGGAGHDSTNGVFRFYSYRDPRLAETFDLFEQSVNWSLDATITDSMLEEAVLGVVGSVDSPGSPAGEIRQAFHHELFGRDTSHRQDARRRYLEVRASDLKYVAEKYLTGTASRALVTSENRLGEVDNEFQIIRVNEQESLHG